MGFTTKKVQQKTRGISFIKWATLFFLGTSCVLFVARAFDITPSVPNAVQYIQKVFLTTSGGNIPGTERIILDGTNGNGTFVWSVTANTVNGTTVNGTTISGTNIKGTTITGTKICLVGDPTTPCITQWPAGGTVVAGGESIWSTWAGGKAYYNSGNVGIGTTGPSAKLQVNWDIKWLNSLIISDDDVTFSEINTSWFNAFLKLNTEKNYFSIFNTQATDTVFTEQAVRLRNYGNVYPMIFWTSNTERMRISANGNVGIGTTSPTEALTVSGNIKLQNSWWIYAAGYKVLRLDATNGYVGIWTVTNPSSELDVGAWTVTASSYLYSSDKRLKSDITSLTDPLKKILSLNGYLFTWKKTGTKDMWVIAQEVEKVFPEIVHTNNEWYKSVEYGNLVAPLIEAIKALNTKIDAQAKEIAALKTKK